MMDLQRNKRILNMYNNVKRQQKRRLSSISYYSKAKDHYFGSLLEIIRVWQKQAKIKKLSKNAILDRIVNRPKSQQCHQIAFPEYKEEDLIQKPQSLVKNVFRVRINSNCQKLKSISLKNPQKPLIKQLNIFSKTISDKVRRDKQIPLTTRSKRLQKQTNLYQQSKGQRSLHLRPTTSKYVQIKKQCFQEDFSLTPWELQ